MTPKSSWDYAILTVRVGLGLWFFIFGLSKVIEGIPKFSRQVAAFEILKDPWNLPVAYVVPWFEILVGLGLITGWLARGASRGALGLTLLFIFVSGQAWVLGLSADCGCFGKWLTLDHGPKMALLIGQLVAVALVIATESRVNRKIFGGSQMRLP
ncbi:MauE/DoxX family redox-associated membrane protein [Haloferula sp.]|uniref:MauE/DoxX family redox-associated membrane protein n=1 Tax=Haloferula sp. TaxID=2497595 RepID=UPI003C72C698